MDCRVIVHFIRHELTKANVERRYIGRTDESIIVDEAPPMPITASVVYGSALKRCEETAKLYFPEARYERHASLNEIDFGAFEMKTYDDLCHDSVYRNWIDDPFTVTPPDGEPFRTFQARVLQAFEQIVQKRTTYTFVVHGGVIRVLLARYLGKSFAEVTAKHHTLYTLTWDDWTKVKEGERCTSYSEVSLTENEITS